ncbi:putative defense protein 3 [Varroa jacobsoni]|uniref:Reelin domain-containing protein n=1 Tax=Varroa destructor TaxID=109461 RepID=A0A7M7KR62_VARDE|nr:putative defense protein 3 [Varroa destructor]XP_022670745.1 putative defense protein 3 [Varroa destructor]XP_022670746.1 putative defense protein 3 [Varroa destructor]XP_022670747.1 putative defense protein 3 [Varroa destructor]XP_022703653.1 putative defense protein 3 [Varroa jacobsoni]XP_022703655.1 putative defense protein 3 [Varroa jacobsoni]XP_022703656.1 putative defense protein 3 [Varroa jacobsoni]XP_022703657.1 putative defense protein 3 [Varroa jacobsoni]
MLLYPILCCSMLAAVLAYPSGAPESACQSLMPQHQVSPQTGRSPYGIYVSANAIHSGEPVTVTLQGGTFRGFLIVARDASTGQVINGSWVAFDPQTKVIACGLTHVSNNDKQRASGQWTAPSGLEGRQIIFQGVVVKDINTFWNNLSSAPVSVR